MQEAFTCRELSLLTPLGYQSGDCGYCKLEGSSQRTPNSRASYYVKSKSLCPSHYQLLVDRGWRRSGTLLYIPDVARSCCPHYTIRLPASEFKPSRDQRQALNRWNRFVLGERYIGGVNIKYPKSRSSKKQDNNTFDFLSVIHESEVGQLKPNLEPDHKFEVTLEADNFTPEKYSLFGNYQQHVHHEGPEDISREGFKRFLCSSPLHRHTGSQGQRYGSYHQCYRLDGRLVAMGVLDLLPHAVSGVYFIYHSDVEKWSFGKLSALREAALALEAGYQYYYMGYYIHSCKKMRYKGDYKPQYVLDYHSGGWDVLDDDMRALMDRRKYASMSRERARHPQQIQLDKPEANGTDADVHEGTNVVESHTDAEPETIMHPVPTEAYMSGLSLLELGMPGTLEVSELHNKVDLDSIRVYLGRNNTHEMQDLVQWETGAETDKTTVKGVIAEFAACIGPDVAKDVLVDFSRG
ncbi:hypothetical protein BAUCODRAFT_122625 [Baudoinia panamericana UAMH 10762]|uniref:Arginyl-tRNA--protein transferase 1 n=1 Tax=Baudoinia panamericana (strain UAMH 10762) TaxID=717646 RepID=M2LQE1_BAUPA|nr:uncharacterized protein BAUCODRAFT_122625 [Baudoinia panamericana UAMH 10762]EMC96642.1 hypothetical protein BAUCODRAFT_122625 [Baudoinia panamericana UAMH 10762]